MKELFYELLEEAKNGSVIFGGMEWPIAFNTQIYKDGKIVKSYNNPDNISCLVIKDEDYFLMF